MRFGDDGRLYAVNPEFGLFGVAPGTGWHTNPNAMRTIEKGNSVFTNVALTDDGDIWWEGMTEEAPAHLTDWKGSDWTPESGEPSSHPNSRFCTPIKQCPILAPEYDDPHGVPIDAILFGGRRKTTIPLVDRGARLGARHLHGRHALLRDDRRRDRRGRRRAPRPDGDAAVHRLQRRRLLQPLDRRSARPHDAAKLPKIFYVNWFRRDDEDGSFLWPGFGENSRVLKWVVERIDGNAEAVETPIGHVPAAGRARHRRPRHDRRAGRQALAVDVDEWRDEIPQIEEWFDKFGDKLPTLLADELATLKARLETA